MHGREGLLHHFLRGGNVIHQERGQADKRAVVLVIQR